MYFDSLWSALQMDGHGIYVWSAYLITMVAVVLILTLPRRKERKILAQLAAERRLAQANCQPSIGST